MYTAQKNNKKLKTLYEQSLHIKSAIPHPLIMGVIRGKVVFTWLTWRRVLGSDPNRVGLPVRLFSGVYGRTSISWSAVLLNLILKHMAHFNAKSCNNSLCLNSVSICHQTVLLSSSDFDWLYVAHPIVEPLIFNHLKLGHGLNGQKDYYRDNGENTNGIDDCYLTWACQLNACAWNENSLYF